ncbi:hypothetical protein SAY86_005614 [Trapa natans]|uniref:Protein HUA2-LIKE 3 n=1 Tax=Trapa natans TaxID=22666 RepID=A0AAN7QTM6_TRANT|nr:hypothetical protein SAY86_005614 [Trapa natans]
MAPSRRKGVSKAAAAAAARRQWKVGDLVLAKLKGFPAWPATVSEPEKWGFSADWKKVLVYFFGTQQIAFCNPVDVEAFTEEKKQTLLVKRQGKGADFVRAVQEIIDIYENGKKQEPADDLNSGTEVTVANGGNSVVSYPDLQVKEVAEAPAETSDAQSKSSILKVKTDCDEHNLPYKETKVLIGVDDLYVKPEKKEPIPAERAKDKVVICTYSLRKKSGGSQVESSTAQRRVPPVRRSRSSSRAEAYRLENIDVPCIISSNSAQDLSSRRSRWTNKACISNGDDRDSPTFVQGGSIEDNGSEIVSMESEGTSFYDGSAADSRFKQEQCEPVTDFIDEEVELRKGLDLPINTVIKKKRKPNRKRLICDVVDPSSNTYNGAATCLVNYAGQEDSENTFGRSTESCPKDDGDEHLPLLKRARVRMGELLSKEDENTSITISEERVLKEVQDNSSDLNHNSFCEGKALQESEVNASEHNINVPPPAEDIIKENPIHDALNSVSLNNDRTSLCMNREASHGFPEECVEHPDQQSSLWKFNKNQSHVSSIDSEDALPPCKRLHHDLEAKSANAAQEHVSNCRSSTILPPTTNICFSSQSPPCLASAYETVNDGQPVMHSVSRHVIVSPSHAHSNQKSSGETNTAEEMYICQPSVERPEIPVRVENAVSDRDYAVKDIGTSISDNPVVDSLMETQSTRTPPPAVEAREPTLKLNQALHDPSTSKDGGNAATPDFGSSGKECAVKQADPSEKTCNSPCLSIEVEKVIAFSSGYEIEALQRSLGYNTENGGNEHIRHECEPSSQDDIMFHVDETTCDHVLRDESHDSCSNTDLDNNGFLSSNQADGIHSSAQVSHLEDRSNICNSDEDRSGNSKQDDGSCSPIEASHFNNSEHEDMPRNSKQDNKSCSPVEVCHFRNSVHDAADSDRKIESSVPSSMAVDKNSNNAGAHKALSMFETALGNLTRTKDSISRATRIAIDCAKVGSASKVLEVLAHSLENESMLYRRVDMFFLVDSIMQWSRGSKGDAGGVYPSLIQGALPRLLSAAAPHGSSAHENRRQCLKVLRLWLERRFLPDSVLRHHIRELDVFSGSSSANPYARRSSRNERAFDDPVREMEGMLVDEYGSNSSFQLPGFCMPQMLKDGDEGSDSDESFEAVTPEHTAPEVSEQETATIGKYRHILQDVDGELEMEDVAPEVEIIPTENPPPHALSVLPHSPHLISPLPPPAVSAPPPPRTLHPPNPIGSAMSDYHANEPHQNSAQNSQGNLTQPVTHPPVLRTERMISGSHYQNSEGREPHLQMPMPNSSYSRRCMENGNREDVSRFDNGRGYNMRAPYAPLSNHYNHSDQRGRPRRDGPPPYSGRYHHHHNRGNGNYHNNNHERMKPSPYDTRENWRFSAPYSGPRYHEKGKSSCSPGPYGGPPGEPERFSNHGWSSYPPRPVGHRNHMPYRPHYEGPGYWRP